MFNKATQVQHSIPRVIKVHLVKSHQDHDINTPETLPLLARLNILADAGTYQAYTDCPTFHQTPFLPSTPVTLVIINNLITSNHISSTSLAYYILIMSKYFKEKHHWSEEPFLSIDWLASDKEYKQLPTGRRLASFKLQNGLWPMFSIIHQHQPTHSPTCPRCCLDPETHNYVLCCLQAQTTQAPKVVYSGNNTQVNTPDPKPNLHRPWAWHKIMVGERPRPTMAISPSLW